MASRAIKNPCSKRTLLTNLKAYTKSESVFECRVTLTFAKFLRQIRDTKEERKRSLTSILRSFNYRPSVLHHCYEVTQCPYVVRITVRSARLALRSVLRRTRPRHGGNNARLLLEIRQDIVHGMGAVTYKVPAKPAALCLSSVGSGGRHIRISSWSASITTPGKAGNHTRR